MDTTTRLILKADDLQRITPRRATDVRTAMTRGLAEYLSTLSVVWAGGRDVRFKKVLDVYSVPENLSEYPSAVVYTPNPVSYLADPDAPLSPALPLALGNRSVLQCVNRWCYY